MYVPKFNEEKDVSTLHTIIESNPLGAWTAIVDGEINANHIPFLLHRNKGELGTLVGHVARANNIWQGFSTEKDSLVIFQGDQSYMSPNWYPSKHEQGKGVPTWCYIVVHAHGVPKKIEDPEWLLQHVNELTDTHESKQGLPWKVSDAPEDFIDMLIGGIVGIEIPITTLTGKWKLDQNRSEIDRRGVIEGLTSTDNPESQRVAEHIKQKMKSELNE
ncbi:MAG: FMN-binding negative transcriptional regulator [Gammaproteobacteria bacterium]|nr:FMN-binding negative transcriptional regulator [Gammaproteobacteria bacterium]